MWELKDQTCHSIRAAATLFGFAKVGRSLQFEGMPRSQFVPTFLCRVDRSEISYPKPYPKPLCPVIGHWIISLLWPHSTLRLARGSPGWIHHKTPTQKVVQLGSL
jgi:hypothetical protein